MIFHKIIYFFFIFAQKSAEILKFLHFCRLPGGLALVVFPLAMPDVVAEFAVGGLGLELRLSGVEARRVLHDGSHSAAHTRELVEASQLGSGVRSRTFAADLGVLAVGVGLVHVGHAGFLTKFTTYVVDWV